MRMEERMAETRGYEDVLARFQSVLEETVKPATKPVGVSLVTAAALPVNERIKVSGRRLTICQQIAYSRYYGWSTLCDRDSSHCVLGSACCGLVVAPQRVLDGTVNCGVYQQDQAAAAAMQQAMPRLTGGSIAAVLTYPLSKPLSSVPVDVVVLYLNPAQVMRCIQAFLYQEGGEYQVCSSGDAGVCSRAVAQVYQTGEPAVEVPCMGDRRFAMTQDHEMVVGVPLSWLDRMADGLEATHRAGIRYPIPFQLPDGCDLPASYITAADD